MFWLIDGTNSEGSSLWNDPSSEESPLRQGFDIALAGLSLPSASLGFFNSKVVKCSPSKSILDSSSFTDYFVLVFGFINVIIGKFAFSSNVFSEFILYDCYKLIFYNDL